MSMLTSKIPSRLPLWRSRSSTTKRSHAPASLSAGRVDATGTCVLKATLPLDSTVRTEFAPSLAWQRVCSAPFWPPYKDNNAQFGVLTASDTSGAAYFVDNIELRYPSELILDGSFEQQARMAQRK